MPDSLESAYAEIAEVLLEKVPDEDWQILSVTCQITSKSSGNSITEKLSKQGQMESFSCGLGAAKILDAVLYLRNEMLEDTGHPIYGMVFKLTHDYKFKIEYSYDQPNGYEEGAELLRLEDGVSRLAAEGVDFKGSNTKPV